MKAKLLSFTFICFSESGLFNELRPKKIKKSTAALISRLGCGSGVSNSQPVFAVCSHRLGSRMVYFG
jgi:hypothetical protein